MTADLILYALIALAAFGVCAGVALPFVWVRGNRQIDAALNSVLDLRDEERSRTNVRVLRAWEVNANMVRARRAQ